MPEGPAVDEWMGQVASLQSPEVEAIWRPFDAQLHLDPFCSWVS